MSSPCILALDPGHKAGYAVDDETAANGCRTGVAHLPRHYPDTGKELSFLERWLAEAIEQFMPGVIVWEAPIIFGGRKGSTIATSASTIEFAFSFQAICELVGARYQIQCWKVNVGTARLHFVGHGRCDKGTVYSRALALGYGVQSHDEADAVAIWDFVKHKYRSGALVAGPLFADPLRSMRRPAAFEDDPSY
jgi:hypothetical protein